MATELKTWYDELMVDGASVRISYIENADTLQIVGIKPVGKGVLMLDLQLGKDDVQKFCEILQTFSPQMPAQKSKEDEYDKLLERIEANERADSEPLEQFITGPVDGTEDEPDGSPDTD